MPARVTAELAAPRPVLPLLLGRGIETLIGAAVGMVVIVATALLHRKDAPAE